MIEVKSIYDIGFERGYAKAKAEPKIHEITINKAELLEAFKDEESFDKYIEKLVDEINDKRRRLLVIKNIIEPNIK